MTADIPPRHRGGRTCAGRTATLAAIATLLAALTRRNR